MVKWCLEEIHSTFKGVLGHFFQPFRFVTNFFLLNWCEKDKAKQKTGQKSIPDLSFFPASLPVVCASCSVFA